MRHLFDKPLGAVSAPFGSCFKCDAWAAVAAGLNAASQFATNQINAERAATDQATYLNLVKKQRDWQKEDQSWTEDYSKRLMDYQYDNFSSPSAQMEAYRKAGINPWLAGQGGAVGSGQSVSPSVPNPSQRSGVTPFQRPFLDNPLGGAADKIFAASSVRSQRIDAMAKFTQSLPDLVKSVGKDAATRIAGSLFGQDIDMSRVDSMIQNEAIQQQYDTKIKEIQQNIAVKYGDKTASSALAIQDMSYAKMNAEMGLMHTEGEVNYAKVQELASDYIRNLADAFKLKKEGDYYVASADQASAMTDLIRLQGNRLTFENLRDGVGGKLEDFYHSDYYQKHLKRGHEIDVNQYSSLWIRTLDKLFIDYIKVSGGAVGSYSEFNGSTTRK